MELLNRLIARYGSADGTVVNRRRLAVARPPQGAQAILLSFWLFRANGTPLSGVSEVRWVLIGDAGTRFEKEYLLVGNRVDIGLSVQDTPAPGAYQCWFEVSAASTGYLRTDSFELHILP